ncbi:MAG: hypothetical protein LBI03_11620 [Clostridiales bacterium]|jgi:hypothetical protein|nr:hypothetical protein [Clostridiales bacterium]
MNETLKNIAERYSCRSFKPEMPSDEILNEIANAMFSGGVCIWNFGTARLFRKKTLPHIPDKNKISFIA